jgi:hypothetical protein
MDGNPTWTDLIPDECIAEMVSQDLAEYFHLTMSGPIQQHHCWREGCVYTLLEDWIDEEVDDQ